MLCWQQQGIIHTLHTNQPGVLGEIPSVSLGDIDPCLLVWRMFWSSWRNLLSRARATVFLISYVQSSLHSWDPAVVLAFFGARATKELSRLQLARKTATILALTIFLRCAKLTSIQFNSIVLSDSEASFTLKKLRKSLSALQRISVEAWPNNVNICPVSRLKACIENNSLFRNASKSDQLFIGSNKPNQ